ncbi:50S ribosomal protein L33 [bacterium]|nr:50S ribosomal protein L33 [Actinomycetota bacterium]MBE33572.1 50S ribosomal protein L33 [bacterium]|tara:strand:- start:423 stop:584 length:162 start_codon:yes stop_codon:yes gene_type:complete
MAKKGHRQHIILESTESGHSYHTTKNKNNTSERIEVKKYDPLIRKHAVYKEKK